MTNKFISKYGIGEVIEYQGELFKVIAVTFDGTSSTITTRRPDGVTIAFMEHELTCKHEPVETALLEWEDGEDSGVVPDAQYIVLDAHNTWGVMGGRELYRCVNDASERQLLAKWARLPGGK